MSENVRRQPPVGVGDEEWKALRHDFKEAERVVRTIAELLPTGALPVEAMQQELNDVAGRLQKMYGVIFEIPGEKP